MPRGVPVECLLARIRGRISFLVSDWGHLLVAPEPAATLPSTPWRPVRGLAEERVFRQALQQEYAWVFRQMEEPERVLFSPFFWLAEVKVLAICLREVAGGSPVDEALLSGSLLGDAIRSVLRGQWEIAAAVKGLSSILAGFDPSFSLLPERFRSNGIGAVEAALHDFSLERFAAARLRPPMGRYITLMIDSRNLLAAAKHVSWRLTRPPLLLSGGGVPVADLERFCDRLDDAGVAALAAQLGGRRHTSLQQESVERLLLESQGEVLRRLTREPGGLGIVLYYLWRCAVEARNLGILSQMAVAGIDAVSRELHQ